MNRQEAGVTPNVRALHGDHHGSQADGATSSTFLHRPFRASRASGVPIVCKPHHPFDTYACNNAG